MIGGKLHICLNLISDPNWHAGDIYIHNLIHAISKLPAAERDEVFLSIAIRKGGKIPDEIRNKVDHIYSERFFHLAFYKLLRKLPAGFRTSLFNFRKIDFYYPGGNLPRKWIFPWGGWIPDFQYRYLTHLFSAQEYQDRDRRNAHLAQESPVLAFSSKNALEDYLKFFPQYKGNEYLLRFVSNANEEWLTHDPLETQHKYALPDRFFMVCNQFWKHKDHGTVIEAIALLRQKNILIDVVCTGATEDFRNPDYYPSLLKLAADRGVADQFKVLGFISRKDQIQLIRRSLAIIQPSLFEGWSTVVEDGRSLGKTIFLSDFPVHLEQDPPHTYFFRQQDAHQLAELIATKINALAPGPHRQMEQEAFEENTRQMIAFGRNFIRMAKSLQELPA